MKKAKTTPATHQIYFGEEGNRLLSEAQALSGKTASDTVREALQFYVASHRDKLQALDALGVEIQEGVSIDWKKGGDLIIRPTN